MGDNSDYNRDSLADLRSRIAGMLRGEEGHQWSWADIAASAPTEDALRTAAEQAGFFETHSWATLKHWRFVGLAWPPDKREAASSFTAHAELASVQPDEKRWSLMRPKLSKREARRLSGRKVMKDDGDGGLDRVLSDHANEDLILDRALEIQALRNQRIQDRRFSEHEHSVYLRVTRSLSTSVGALDKALELVQDLAGDELELALEQIREIEVKAAHAAATTGTTPDTVPDDLLSGYGTEDDR